MGQALKMAGTSSTEGTATSTYPVPSSIQQGGLKRPSSAIVWYRPTLNPHWVSLTAPPATSSTTRWKPCISRFRYLQCCTPGHPVAQTFMCLQWEL